MKGGAEVLRFSFPGTLLQPPNHCTAWVSFQHRGDELMIGNG